jgi:hypothetical protein
LREEEKEGEKKNKNMRKEGIIIFLKRMAS